MLENIKSPSDVKNLTYAELDVLADEIRNMILTTVSQNGGHLASNLGTVEATIALHKVFDCPADSLVFDVGHQCYTHKLLTGRYSSFHTLRQTGGISGFLFRSESPYDVLSEGHCGSALSSAMGIAEANHISGSDAYAVAIVGDGAISNGMFYEAMNNCETKDRNLIILLNDNQMSIARNIGGMHNYLTKIRTSKGYFTFKHRFENFLSSIPVVGNGLSSFFRSVKNSIKRLLIRNTIFEDMGLVYLGPVVGNDVRKMTDILEEAKSRKGCCLVHMITKKGLGYEPAEREPEKYHSVSPFDIQKGVSESLKETFSSRFGAYMCNAGEKDCRICAITAAMGEGTGLNRFSELFRDRFFDVGISEEHSVAFAGGLSAGGMKPVICLYSTFSQRVFDQLWQDISLQNLHAVLAIDRAGLVPGDGITHQGIFDVSLMTSIPGITVYSPETFSEFDSCMDRAMTADSLTVVRYPKGTEPVYKKPECIRIVHREDMEVYDFGENPDVVIFTYGRVSEIAFSALERLPGISVRIVKLVKIWPVDRCFLRSLSDNVRLSYFLEEGIQNGGISEKIASFINSRCRIHAINGFIEHGNLNDLFNRCGFSSDVVSKEILEELD